MLKRLLIALSIFLSGCAYSSIKVPFDTDVNRTELGHKVGTASTYSVLWLVAWGDSGVEEAAKAGGLTTINHMDMRIFSVLFGVFTRTDTIVYGD